MKAQAITAEFPAITEVEIEGIIFDSSCDTDIAALAAISDGPELALAEDFGASDFDEDHVTVPINIKGLVSTIERCKR